MTAFGYDGTAVDLSRYTPHHQFLLPPPKPGKWEPEYNGRGQYKVPDPEGSGKVKAYTRTTTMTKTLDDNSMVVGWEKRRLLQGLLRRGENTVEVFESLDRMFADEDANKGRIAALVDDLEAAGDRNRAAEFGTAVHAWAEEVDCGRILPRDVPEMFREHVDTYLQALARRCIAPLPEYTERVIYNSKANCCGQLDRGYLLADQSIAMGDVKTSKTLGFSYGAYAMQLAIYQGADYMLSEDGTRWEPMPKFRDDFAVLAHVPSNDASAADLYTYDLAFGREMLEVALKVREMRRRQRKEVISLHPFPVPTSMVVNAHADVYRLRTASDIADIQDILPGIREGHADTGFRPMLDQLATDVIDMMTA